MKIDRAIEILDPEHREHYDGLEEVNEACRMGMEILRQFRDGELVKVVRCKDCIYLADLSPSNSLYPSQDHSTCKGIRYVSPDSFCSDGIRRETGW